MQKLRFNLLDGVTDSTYSCTTTKVYYSERIHNRIIMGKIHRQSLENPGTNLLAFFCEGYTKHTYYFSPTARKKKKE